MWRWSFLLAYILHYQLVFSTYVEMILRKCHYTSCLSCILHVCGDDPFCFSHCEVSAQYSPRMWRWSQDNDYHLMQAWVFSTYVEMILTVRLIKALTKCILHVCGDDPRWKNGNYAKWLYSPRMWSCFWCPQVWRFCSALVLAKLLTRIIQ